MTRGGTTELAATEEYRALLEKLHRLSIPLYRVEFSYETKRGNFRRGEKFYFSLNGEHEDFDLEIKMRLEDWVRDMDQFNKTGDLLISFKCQCTDEEIYSFYVPKDTDGDLSLALIHFPLFLYSGI